MSFNSFPRGRMTPAHSRHSGAGGQQGSGQDFGETALKTGKTSEVRCPPVTRSDFPLLSPLITVSEGKWWKGGGGLMNRWRGLGRKGWSYSTMWPCVKCSEPGNEPQGVSPFSSYFHSEPCWRASPGKRTQAHNMFVLMFEVLFFSIVSTRCENSNYKTITAGMSSFMKTQEGLFSSHNSLLKRRVYVLADWWPWPLL